MSEEYYKSLPSLKLHYNYEEAKIFERAEYHFTGDFLIIYQLVNKTVVPLKDIFLIKYPHADS